MIELSLKVHDIECIAHKYKCVCDFLHNYSTEYSHMALYISGINNRMCNILNRHNVIHNIYENIDLKKKSSRYLRGMVQEILDVTKMLEEEHNDINNHYHDNIKHHYQYVRDSDVYNKKNIIQC
jgi:predicted RNase H-related nuclease YkuK (DUF458 family)